MRTPSLFVHGSYFISILFFLMQCAALCNMLLQDFAGKTLVLFDMKVLPFKTNGYTIPVKLHLPAVPDTVIEYKLGQTSGNKKIYPKDAYSLKPPFSDTAEEALLRNPATQKRITVFKWIADDSWSTVLKRTQGGTGVITWSGTDEYDMLANRLAYTTYTPYIPALSADALVQLRGKTAVQNILLAAPNYLLLLLYLFITYQVMRLLGRLRRGFSFLHNLHQHIQFAGMALVLGHALLWLLQHLNADAFGNIQLWQADDGMQDDDGTSVYFTAGSYFSPMAVYIGLGLIVLSKLFAYGQQLEQQAADLLKVKLEVQEHTLLHVARELHDKIGVRLIRTKLTLNTLRWHEPETARSNVAGCVEDIGTVMTELRALVQGLDAGVMLSDGLAAALRQELHRTGNTGIEALLDVPDTLPALTDGQEIVLLRIVQEALHNVLKHAAATKVKVALAVLPGGGIRLSIADNGRGSAANAAPGSGTLSMRQRAAFIGGIFNSFSPPGGGHTVEVTIPRL